MANQPRTLTHAARWLYLLIFSLVTPLLSLDVDTFDVEFIDQDAQRGPFTIALQSDAILKSSFKEDALRNQKMGFQLIDLDLDTVFYYDEKNKTGFSFLVSYTNFNLDWSENPFGQTLFPFASFALGAATGRIPRWFIRAQAKANISLDTFSLKEYTNYNLLLFGSYNYSNSLNTHIGALALTGMHMNRLYPILGFDYKWSQKTMLNLVYPINMSVVHHIGPCLYIEGAVRFFSFRARGPKKGELPKGLWEYRNQGLECGITYRVGERIRANLHVGGTLEGKLAIGDQKNNNKETLHVRSAPYFGAELTMNF